MGKDSKIRSILLMSAMGIAVYYFLNPPKAEQKEPLKPFLDVGDLISDGIDSGAEDYVAKYFKDSEYFGKHEIPKMYYQNWKVLRKQLDIIRAAFGSPILVKRGYEPHTDTAFNKCQAVSFYPKNNRYLELDTIIESLKNSDSIQYKLITKEKNNWFTLYI